MVWSMEQEARDLRGHRWWVDGSDLCVEKLLRRERFYQEKLRLERQGAITTTTALAEAVSMGFSPGELVEELYTVESIPVLNPNEDVTLQTNFGPVLLRSGDLWKAVHAPSVSCGV